MFHDDAFNLFVQTVAIDSFVFIHNFLTFTNSRLKTNIPDWLNSVEIVEMLDALYLVQKRKIEAANKNATEW